MNVNRYSIRFPREEHRLTLDMSEAEAEFIKKMFSTLLGCASVCDILIPEEEGAVSVVINILSPQKT